MPMRTAEAGQPSDATSAPVATRSGAAGTPSRVRAALDATLFEAKPFEAEPFEATPFAATPLGATASPSGPGRAVALTVRPAQAHPHRVDPRRARVHGVVGARR